MSVVISERENGPATLTIKRGVALLHATVTKKWAGIAIDTVYKEC